MEAGPGPLWPSLLVSEFGGCGRYSFVACLTLVKWPLTMHSFAHGAPFLLLRLL